MIDSKGKPAAERGASYKEALRRQCRQSDTYISQLENILKGVYRTLLWWIALSVIYICAVLIFVFITTDISAYTQENIQEGVRIISMMAGALTALGCISVNIGRFENVFRSRAENLALRVEQIDERIQSEVQTTENLLVEYGLITEADIQRRLNTAEG